MEQENTEQTAVNRVKALVAKYKKMVAPKGAKRTTKPKVYIGTNSRIRKTAS